MSSIFGTERNTGSVMVALEAANDWLESAMNGCTAAALLPIDTASPASASPVRARVINTNPSSVRSWTLLRRAADAGGRKSLGGRYTDMTWRLHPDLGSPTASSNESEASSDLRHRIAPDAR